MKFGGHFTRYRKIFFTKWIEEARRDMMKAVINRTEMCIKDVFRIDKLRDFKKIT